MALVKRIENVQGLNSQAPAVIEGISHARLIVCHAGVPTQFSSRMPHSSALSRSDPEIFTVKLKRFGSALPSPRGSVHDLQRRD